MKEGGGVLQGDMQWSVEVTYMALVAGLFILPRGLQRLRIPGAITALGLGAAAKIGFPAIHPVTAGGQLRHRCPASVLQF